MLDDLDDWIWDFWSIRHDALTHLFFLTASRSLGDPDLRHHHARVGHASSPDLSAWTRLPDALAPQPAPAFDDLATWTGSVVADPSVGAGGGWRMFTSGLSSAESGLVQRIGSSVSEDLLTWHRTDLVLEADPRWYLLADHRGETHWRDPFVVRDDAGRWHMYVTAKASPRLWPGERGNGVVAHATSSDLVTWSVGPPLAPPTGRFDQAEVVSLARVEGRWAAVFSCLGPELVGEGGVPGSGGVWSVPVDGPGAPIDLDAAVRLTGEDRYVGRVLPGAGADEGPVFLAFRNADERGAFVGGVADPVGVGWRDDGQGLVLLGPSA